MERTKEQSLALEVRNTYAHFRHPIINIATDLGITFKQARKLWDIGTKEQIKIIQMPSYPIQYVKHHRENNLYIEE